MDELQTLLESWLLQGGPDRPAIDRLCQEWRPIIRRYLVEPDEAELEDALQQALLTLVLSTRIVSRQPENARAWRRQVLKNHLTDGVRRRGRRQHAEHAQHQGLAPQAEREAWRAQKEARRAPRQDLQEARAVEPPRPSVELDEGALDLLRRRAQVAAALPTLPLGGRTLLALCLGMDPAPWAEELADKVGGTAEDALSRIAEARQAVAEQGHEPMPLAVARVLYPQATDTETAKRTFRRARKELEATLGGER